MQYLRGKAAWSDKAVCCSVAAIPRTFRYASPQLVQHVLDSLDTPLLHVLDSLHTPDSSGTGGAAGAQGTRHISVDSEPRPLSKEGYSSKNGAHDPKGLRGAQGQKDSNGPNQPGPSLATLEHVRVAAAKQSRSWKMPNLNPFSKKDRKSKKGAGHSSKGRVTGAGSSSKGPELAQQRVMESNRGVAQQRVMESTPNPRANWYQAFVIGACWYQAFVPEVLEAFVP